MPICIMPHWLREKHDAYMQNNAANVLNKKMLPVEVL